MERRWFAVALCLAVVLAGCSAVAPGASGTATPVPDSAEGPLLPPGEDGVNATITRVVDGDTMGVTFENGIEDTVRLLGVDTPETRGENTPGEFEGVPDTQAGRDCLARAGDRASEFATEALSGREVVFYADPAADRRGSFGRLLGYIVVDGTNFNYRLLRNGHARVFDAEFSLSDAFYGAESTAMDAGIGLWACAEDTGAGGGADSTASVTPDGSLTVVEIHADAEGNDNENLEDEYVVFRNTGEEPLDLSGWTVTDEAGKQYTFPEGTTVDPGERVTLHTGSGTDSSTDLYWGQTGAVWNNGGDTVTVRDDSGTVVTERSY